MAGFYRDKIVVVTGGNSGIGRELVRQLADDGAVVTAWGRNAETGTSLVGERAAAGHTVSFTIVDVQDPDAVEAALNNLLKQHGRIDYMFHAAGIILGGEVRDHSIEQVRTIMQTNVLGTSHVDFYTYRIMATQGFGHIINLSSGAGIFPVPLMGVYSASKFAVLGMSEVLRMEGAALGVKVSAVAPGLVDTPIYDRAMYSRTDKAKTLSSLKKSLYMIQPDQAARTILRGVRHNRPVIHTQLYVRLSWLAYRLAPWAFRFFTSKVLIVFRRRYRTQS